MFQAPQGEPGDVISDPFDLIRTGDIPSIKEGDDGPGIIVIEALAYDTCATQTDLLFADGVSNDLSNDGGQKHIERTDDLFGQAFKDPRRLCHLASH